MKKAIVTIAIGDYHQKLFALVRPSFEAYAARVGAELIVWTDQGNHSLPHYRKLDLGDLLNEYDRVCYIDADIIIRQDAPDIFEMVPENRFGAFEEGRFADRAETLTHFFKVMGFEPEEDLVADYWNTGVMCFSKGHQPIFLQPKKEVSSFYEQTYLNFLFHALKVQMFNLPYRMNRMTLTTPHTGEDHLDGYFIHYAGFKDIHGEEFLLDCVKRDLKRLEEAAPEFKFKRRFLIAVQGGIGDQICAEPAIRNLIENVYPGSEFHICSFWPEIFQHLAIRKDLDVHLYDDAEKVPNNTALHVMETYRESTHESWGVMAQGAVHMVDFCSVQLTRQTLPLGKRQPRLFVSHENLMAVDEKLAQQGRIIGYNDLVVVHPGRGWATKTFPASWWNQVLEEIVKLGLKPVIIGKDKGGEHGVVDGVCHPFAINLTNQLDLHELFALISTCPVTISNDSSPVHIAGAFNNWIGMVGTCKQPEMVLPFRGPVAHPLWRARALEADVPRKWYREHLVRPAEINPPTMDFLDCPITEYLPSPESVALFALQAVAGHLPDYPEM